MCGIVGVTSNKSVTSLLIDGLKNLEYRGYDSAGISLFENNNVKTIKSLGNVARLQNKLSSINIDARTGIGHTRWATHGEPSEINAHPHNAKNQIYGVHNGIIENYQELKDILQKQNYKFYSSTDTEVGISWIHYKVKEFNNFEKGLKEAVKNFNGSFAFVLVDADQPDILYGVCGGSPLLLGIGVGISCFASDRVAFNKEITECYYLQSGDIISINNSKINFLSKGDDAAQTSFEKIVFELEQTNNSQEYNHVMLKEINEQPLVFQNILSKYVDFEKRKCHILPKEQINALKRIDNIKIVACGSSYNAGLVSKYWFEETCNLPCDVEIASEFRYRKRAKSLNTVLICISQSGETADTIAALKDSRNDYGLVICLTNMKDSSIGRISDIVILTHAGREFGVAATKTFTSQLLTLGLLCLQISDIRQLNIPLNTTYSHLRNIADFAKDILALEKDIKNLAKQIKDYKNIIFLGRSYLYPIALEGALKLKELSYIHANAYPIGELKHGPLALIDKNTPVIALANDDWLINKVTSGLQEVKARGGRLFILTNYGDLAKSFNANLLDLKSGKSNEEAFVFPILFTIALQLISYHVANLLGHNVDQPRNLAKSVTVE